MKFFTVDWWRGIQEGTVPDPCDAYRAHFSLIREQLPPDLAALSESVSLHDSRLRVFNLIVEDALLKISLDGSGPHGCSRRFSLTYVRVESFQSLADPEAGLAGPHGYGDWGYDEAHVLAPGRFEHRVLFSTGIEFRIVFADFSMSFEDGDQ